MSIDNQLINDGTYYVDEADGQIAACGGWSRRAVTMETRSTRTGS